MAPVLSRRALLGFSLAPLAMVGAGCLSAAESKPTALVYRGPASSEGCPEAIASVLRSGPTPFTVRFCGPDESTPLSHEALDQATLYAQPGGGDDLDAAWRSIRPFAPALRSWVHGGGRYLGICMGGYLAGSSPGFGLFDGDSGEYVTSPGATVHTNDDAEVTVAWRGAPRRIYFQGGPNFSLGSSATAQVLARYSNGDLAALVAQAGRGRVGVCGPHPEAPRSWYTDSGFTPPSPMPFDLARNLIDTTISTTPLTA